MLNAPVMAEVKSAVRENSLVKTFTLNCRMNPNPGQFVMLWIPGVDEKPFSFSETKSKIKVTVKKLGPFTQRLFKLKEGDLVGVRGPYGNGFRLKGKSICFVAGGVGLAPLMPLIEQAVKNKKKVTVIAGFRSRKDLLFHGRLSKLKCFLHMVTDDGSFNKKAYASDMLKNLLKQQKYDTVYCCGPELMMKKVMDLCLKNKTACQFSVERYMKCAIGLCGSCCINGYRVCKDGPVFTGSQLKGTEFGKYTRNAEGKKTRLLW